MKTNTEPVNRKHQYDRSNGFWACRNCHRWTGTGPKVCDPAKERQRLREIVRRARSRNGH